MGFGDERGDGGYRESFLSHYAADVTVPQPSDPSDEWCDHHESPGSCPVFGCLNHEPSEPEPCDHGSYWTDHDGRDHCLVCPHVSQPSE